jgi:hypothetical protein
MPDGQEALMLRTTLLYGARSVRLFIPRPRVSDAHGMTMRA